jgi:hypothetical protein
MKKLNVAVIGSGLSAIGSLAAIRRYLPNSNVTIYTHTEVSNLKTRHKLLFHSGSPSFKYGLHLAKSITNSNIDSDSNDPIVKAISYYCFGGSSKVWGGACHPLLDYETQYFDPYINKGYEEVAKLFGCDSQFADYMSKPVSVNSGANYTKTLTLGTRLKLNTYRVSSVTNDLITKFGRVVNCDVKKITNIGKQILLEYDKVNGSRTYAKYDYVVIAGGVVGTTTLLSSYYDNLLSLTYSTNDQYFFVGKYSMTFNRSTFGPPSILVNSISEHPIYIQLYPINLSSIVNSENLFLTSKDALSSGFMAAYLYIDCRSSAKVQIQSFRGGPCKSYIVDPLKKIYLDTKKLKNTLKGLGIDIIGNPLKLFPTSSQHIGGGFQNSLNSSNSNIAVVDSSVMKHLPLCTIGFTSAANAYNVTRNFFI